MGLSVFDFDRLTPVQFMEFQERFVGKQKGDAELMYYMLSVLVNNMYNKEQVELFPKEVEEVTPEEHKAQRESILEGLSFK